MKLIRRQYLLSVSRRVLGFDWGETERCRNVIMWARHSLFSNHGSSYKPFNFLLFMDQVFFSIYPNHLIHCFSISACLFSPIFILQKLPLVEERLGNLITDDPSVIETCLGDQGDSVLPDQTSVVNR